MSEEMQSAPAEQAPPAGGSANAPATRSTPRRKTAARAAGPRRGSGTSGAAPAGAALDPTRDDPMQAARRIWPD